ncbi:putative F-box protein At3g58820 isoform X1 [Arabidopsis lyrata subsp. lyrata]|uniref:putative F-box protein At3g58820 isoform X1 n=1 Tax=Arabidopsis lyrata subsp. lyrata TaxID=81972 RepID=UPI000A29A9F4|nr:putative F-box protein At3g58820 isoform X1 [Arabidopsis lyrata subsp. lyrata]|eukprot:XP_020880546.1 putative F-box protein At3g58820 isoform X1 [Arabidopsis lyrata subsp. lyrata]
MDRVSSLPNELLCHILSFLTTKEAALTSLLSKRWRNLLAFVPYLYIDDSVFLHPEEGKRDRPEIIQSFMDFVDRILALQGDSPIKKCSIKCLTEVVSVRVDGWISNVLARGVLDLDLLIILDSEGDDHYLLPPKCFQSSTLVSLKLDGGIDIGWVAGSIFLPMLKTLTINSARIDNFEILLHALPALEELSLFDVISNDQGVNISSASLKTLTIYDIYCSSTLSFDTPSLIYFKYTGFVAKDYPVVNMKNLFDARIILLLHIQRAREPDEYHWFDQDVALRYSNVWKLFLGLQNVTNLYLSPGTLEVLSRCCESMPVFKNLKSLAIKSNKERGWQAMPVLLRNCPHLETLVIKGLLHHVTDKCGDACDCISREDKGRSLTSCPVKMLEIRGFRGTMKEMTMIKHFLVYFPCLKEMNIYVEENDPTELRVPEVSKCIMQMMEEYNKLSSCNVELL